MPLSASETLDREYLEIRAKLLQVAASLDRLERGAGDVSADPRLAKLRDAVDVLADGSPHRAERLQMAFSLPYHDEWRTRLGLG